MTPPQKALLRYWLAGLAVLLVLLWLGAQLHWRLLLLPALIIVVLIDTTLRPPRPAGVLTPLQLVRNSRAWTGFFFLYATAAVVLAILAMVSYDIGNWMRQHAWLLGPLILVLIVGPVVQSEIARYKAYGATPRD
jgi:hypothetical protein